MVEKKFLPSKIDGKSIVKTIKRSDPLDLAIWKLMSDSKRRTSEEIRLALKEYGFSQEEVGERVRVLFCSSNRRWFDSQGKGNRTTYQLRKNRLERPFARGGVSIDSIADISDILVITEEAGKMSTLTSALGNTPTGKPPFEDLHKAAFALPPPSEKSMQLAGALSSPETIEATEDKLNKELEMNQEQNSVTEIQDTIVPIYEPHDTLETKILRVLRITERMFSAKDLSVLLEVTPTVADYRLRKLAKLNLLTRVKETNSTPSDLRIFYYFGSTEPIESAGTKILETMNDIMEKANSYQELPVDLTKYRKKPDSAMPNEPTAPDLVKPSVDEAEKEINDFLAKLPDGKIDEGVECSEISEEDYLKVLNAYLKTRSEIRPMFTADRDSVTIKYDTKPKIVVRGMVLSGKEAREIKSFVEGISSLSGDTGIPSVMKDASIEIQGRQYTFTDIEDIGIELMDLFD